MAHRRGTHAYIAPNQPLRSLGCSPWTFKSLLGCEFTSHTPQRVRYGGFRLGILTLVELTRSVFHVLQIFPRFGLIDEGTDRWTTFVAEIERLNATAEPGVQFKVFFLGRHGQGYRAFFLPAFSVSRSVR